MVIVHRIINLLLLALFAWLMSCNDDWGVHTDCLKSDLSLELDSLKSASDCQSFNGVIGVYAFGGKQPYQYSLDGVTFVATGLFDEVKTGIYSVYAKDANNCSVTISNVYVESMDFMVTTGVTADNLCLGGDGSVTIGVAGGSPPYSYKLESGPFVSENVFVELDQGNHKITVLDDNNCTVDLNITVPHGDTQVSWSLDVLPIIEVNCSVSGCHDGVSRNDLRIHERAAFFAADIKFLTETRQMPFNDEELTNEEIKIIGCWVMDGAREN